jgi:hypothetical protein
LSSINSAHDYTACGFDLQLFADGDTAPADASATPDVTPDSTPPAADNTPPATPPAKDTQKSLLGDQPKDTPAPPPDTYDDFKLPDGVQWDDATGGEFKTLAKEMGLSQDNAQKMVDLGTKLMSGSQEAIQEAFQKQSDEWRSQSTEKFKDADIQTANKALQTFATPELITLLQDTGLANNPEVVGMFNKIGSTISEGRMVDAAAQAQSRLYPHSAEMYK